MYFGQPGSEKCNRIQAETYPWPISRVIVTALLYSVFRIIPGSCFAHSLFVSSLGDNELAPQIVHHIHAQITPPRLLGNVSVLVHDTNPPQPEINKSCF